MDSDITKAATDQTPPAESTGPDAWEEVIAHVAHMREYLGNDPERTSGLQKLTEAMQARREFGLKKYGMPLRPNNGQDPLQEAFQESLDMVVYLACRKLERPGDIGAMQDFDKGLFQSLRLTHRLMEQNESQ